MSQPKYETHSGPSEKFHIFSIYEKTVNYKNSWKVPFGSLKGPLQISIDIAPLLLTLDAISRWFMFQQKNGQLLEHP